MSRLIERIRFTFDSRHPASALRLLDDTTAVCGTGIFIGIIGRIIFLAIGCLIELMRWLSLTTIIDPYTYVLGIILLYPLGIIPVFIFAISQFVMLLSICFMGIIVPVLMIGNIVYALLPYEQIVPLKATPRKDHRFYYADPLCLTTISFLCIYFPFISPLENITIHTVFFSFVALTECIFLIIITDRQ